MPLADALRQAVPGARVSSEAPDRRAYSRDLWPRGLVELQSGVESAPGPQAIVWPENSAQVVTLIDFARREGIALVPFGAGSGVCGGVLPERDSVIVDLKRFADFRIADGPTLDAGAGALGVSLEERLVEAGYTTGHYPSSILCSTVGGWVAARGAGQCSGRYGKIEDMVTSLEFVLGTGEVVRAESRCHGPELVPLLIGSEGTLGIITRVGLRLHAAPRERAFSAHSFETMDAGLLALRELFQAGHRPAVARLYDPLDSVLLASDDTHQKTARGPKHSGLKAAALRAVLRVPALAARALAVAEQSLVSRVALVLVHEGDDATLHAAAARADALCAARGGTPLGEGPARAWYHHRYHVSYRQAPVFRSGCFSDTMEVSAPWSRLREVYHAVRRALGAHALVMAHSSHSYPDGGSIYFTFAGTAHGGNSTLEVYDQAWRVALSAALDAGASLSHHHGIGRSKAPRLPEELGAALGVVRALKGAWDPDGILNPGALLPARSPGETRSAPAVDSAPTLDRESALCRLPGSLTLAAAEAWLSQQGHTLGIEADALASRCDLSVNDWIAEGLVGLRTRYADPVGVRLSGFTARLRNGRRITLPAAPRRAVGPDLSALFAGAGGDFGSIESATLGAPPAAAHAPPLSAFSRSEPALNDGELAALARLRRALEA